MQRNQPGQQQEQMLYEWKTKEQTLTPVTCS
jgi:hypothetical protein